MIIFKIFIPILLSSAVSLLWEDQGVKYLEAQLVTGTANQTSSDNATNTTIAVTSPVTTSGRTANQTSSSPLNISANINPKVITTDQKALISVNLRNTIPDLIDGLDVQLITPGLEVLAEKQWPEHIYPNSSLSGAYVLRPTESGRHSIYVTATYVINNTIASDYPKQLTSQATAGEIFVQPAWSLVWLNNNAALTGILGIVIGATITKISDIVLIKLNQNKERNERIEKLKGYLLQWLDVNEERLTRNENAIFASWYAMTKEGVYSMLVENRDINTRSQNLYVRFEAYNKQIRKRNLGTLSTNDTSALNKEIVELKAAISETRGIIKGWNA